MYIMGGYVLNIITTKAKIAIPNGIGVRLPSRIKDGRSYKIDETKRIDLNKKRKIVGQRKKVGIQRKNYG